MCDIGDKSDKPKTRGHKIPDNRYILDSCCLSVIWGQSFKFIFMVGGKNYCYNNISTGLFSNYRQDRGDHTMKVPAESW